MCSTAARETFLSQRDGSKLAQLGLQTSSGRCGFASGLTRVGTCGCPAVSGDLLGCWAGTTNTYNHAFVRPLSVYAYSAPLRRSFMRQERDEIRHRLQQRIFVDFLFDVAFY